MNLDDLFILLAGLAGVMGSFLIGLLIARILGFSENENRGRN